MILDLCFLALSRAQQDAAAAPEKPAVSIEDEVLGNLEGLQIGPIHVADLALPEDFMRRISDRIIRSSFEDRYRIIVPDPKPAEGQRAVLATAPAAVGQPPIRRRPAWIVATSLGVTGVVAGILLSRRRRANAS